MTDPDLRDKGGPSSRPLDKPGGGRSPKKNFSVLRASVLTKKKGGPRAPRVPPLDPPLDTSIRTDGFYGINRITFVFHSIFVDKERE